MSANRNDTSNPSFDEIEIDKLAKKQLVIKTITDHLSSTSNDEIFRQIYNAVSVDGSKLTCKILSGGYTNYSYKVTVEDKPNLCLFAKLSFEYALWNPDRSSHYSLKRTDNECEIMKSVSKIAPGKVVKPLGCWNVQQDDQRMKLFVTEWSPADEQFCNQFIDGVVDPRIAPKLAETLASLHAIKEFDPEFNANVKPCMESLNRQMKAYVIEACAKKEPNNRTEEYCSEVGADILVMKVVDGIISNYNQRDCLIHSDSHVFNILVESKPSVEELESFGPNGTMVLCDWEMTMAGPMGKDVGLALSFPIACYVAHALKGDVVESIFEYITTLVDCYLTKIEQAGVTCLDKVALYRNIIGYSGWFQFIALHFMKAQASYPQDKESNIEYVQDAMGVLGLKMMQFSFDDALIPNIMEFNDVKATFEEMLQEEVSKAYKIFAGDRRKSKHKMQPRKSSFLRAANRRISDAMLNFASAEACLAGLDLSDL